MPAYNASNLMGGTKQAMTTTFKTVISLTAATATLTQAKINEIKAGPSAVPNVTDCEIVWTVSAQTTVGTGTAVTPTQLGGTGSRAAGTVATANHTVEPTITANSSVWDDGFNQRQGFIWQALPGQELVIVATNLNGLGLRALSSTYTGTVQGGVNIVE